MNLIFSRHTLTFKFVFVRFQMIFAGIQNRVDDEPEYGEFAIRVLNHIMLSCPDEKHCMRSCILKSMEDDVKSLHPRLVTDDVCEYLAHLFIYIRSGAERS